MLNIDLPYDTNPIPRHISKISENIRLHKNEYINMFTAALFIIAKNFILSITWWIDKQNSIYPYNGLPLNTERNKSLIHEWTLNMMNLENIIVIEKIFTKRGILYDWFYLQKCP